MGEWEAKGGPQAEESHVNLRERNRTGINLQPRRKQAQTGDIPAREDMEILERSAQAESSSGEKGRRNSALARNFGEEVEGGRLLERTCNWPICA